MAIYSFNNKIVKRTNSNGQIRNAVFAAAYYRAEKRTCYNIEETKDFSSKQIELIYKDCILPSDAPEWAVKLRNAMIQTEGGSYIRDPSGQIFSEYAWNLVEQMERRHDSQIYIRDIIALPIELNQKQAIELAKEFAKEVFAVDGVFCEVAVHWCLGNPHVHYMRPAFRQFTETGFSKKIRLKPSDIKKAILKTRALWAEFANRKLLEAGFDVRIDHRSFKDRGLDLDPTVKVGKATHMHGTEHQELRVAKNQKIRAENYQKLMDHPEILMRKMAQEHQMFSSDQVQEELSRYVVNAQVLDLIQKSEDLSDEVLVRQIIDILKTEQTVFSEQLLKTAILERTDDNQQYQSMLHQIIQSPELLKLGLGEDGREHYVTREAFQLELNLIKTAEGLNKKSTFGVLSSDVDHFSKHYGLNSSQHIALNYITQGSNIALVRGMAGTGKTYLLKPANDIWKRAGYRVHGVAFLGRAAAGLEQETGIRSKTIHQFLNAVRLGGTRLGSRDIIVMDEKGMTSLDDLSTLLNVVEAAGAKFVAVGDIEQTQSTGRGAAARALMETVGGVVLDDILRQGIDWQRRATFLMETQKTGDGFDAYDHEGKVYSVKTRGEAIQLTVQQWFDQWLKNQDGFQNHMMTAYRNDTVDELNRIARSRLIEASVLDQGILIQTRFGSLEMAVGERLLFRRNDTNLGVKNGDFATIEKIDENRLWVRLDRGELKEVLLEQYQDINYGYAATIHKLQGYTGDYVRLYVDSKGFDRHLFLVGATRHRRDLSIIFDQEQFEQKHVLREIISRDGLKDHVFDFPAAFAMRRGLEPTRVLKHVTRLFNTAKQKLQDHGLWLWNYQSHLESDQKSDIWYDVKQRRQEAVIVANFCDRRMVIGEKIGELNALPGYQLAYTYLNIPNDEDIELGTLYLYTQEQQVWVAARNSQDQQNPINRFLLAEAQGFSQKQLRQLLEITSDDLGADCMSQQARESFFSVMKSLGYPPIDQKEVIQRRRDIYKKQLANSKLADQIELNFDRLQLALDRNRISREVIRKSVAFGQRHRLMKELAKDYHDKSYYHPELSNEILSELALYYGHIISALGPDKPTKGFINEVKHQAYHYRHDEHADLFTAYQKIDINLILNYLDHIYEIDNVLIKDDAFIQSMQAKLDTLKIERNRLANQIVQNITHHEAIFDIFGADIQHLRVHQSQHQARERVKQYAALIKNPNYQDSLLTHWLANQIKQRSRRHHPYVMELLADADGWKSIHLDRWHYEHRRAFAQKSKIFKSHDRLVRRYRELCSLSSNAWKMALKKRQRSSIHTEKLIKQAQGLSFRRDEIAYQLLFNKDNNVHELAGIFSFEHISLEKMTQRAKAYQLIEAYCTEKSEVKKLRFAHYMMMNFKTFGHLIAHRGIEEEVRQLSQHYHYLMLTKKSPDISVKQLIRLVEHYEQKRQLAGEAWRTHKQFEKQHQSTDYTLPHAQHALQQRNLAAFNLLEFCAKHPLMEPQIEGFEVGIETLEKHAKQHIAYQHITDYLNTKAADKGELAYAILSDRSGHHFIYEMGLDFKQLGQKSQTWLERQKVSKNIYKSETLEQSSQKYWDINLISSRLMEQPETTYLAILGEPKKRTAKEWRYPGGLIVTMRGNHAGQWYSFSEGQGGGPLKAIQFYKSYSFQDAMAYGASLAGLSEVQAMTETIAHVEPIVSKEPDYKAQLERTRRIESAQSIWEGSQSIQGSLAERYFVEHRKVTDIGSMEMHYWPSGSAWVDYKDGKRIDKINKIPAVVIPVKNADHKLTGVQRIYLDAQTAGKNTFMDNAKLSKGITQGSAGIIQVGKSGGRLYIAEGPETCASIALVEPDATVLASLGVNNLTHMEKVIQSFEPKEVILAADNDGAHAKTKNTTEEAFETLSQSLLKNSIQSYLIYPPELEGLTKVDWNDILKHHGAEQLKALLKERIQSQRLYYHGASTIAYTIAEHYLREVKGLIGVDLSEVRFSDQVVLPNQKQTAPAILIPAINKQGNIQAELILYLNATGDQVIQTSVHGPAEGAVIPIQQNPDVYSLYISDNFEDAKAITLGNQKASVYVDLSKYQNLIAIDWVIENQSKSPTQLILTSDNATQETKNNLYALSQPIKKPGCHLLLAHGRLEDRETHVRIHESMMRQKRIQNDGFIQHTELTEPEHEKVTLKEKVKRAMHVTQKSTSVSQEKTRPSTQKPLSYYVTLTSEETQLLKTYFECLDTFEQHQDYINAVNLAKRSQITLDGLSEKVGNMRQNPQMIIIEGRVNLSNIRKRLATDKTLGLHDFKRLYEHILEPKLDRDTQEQIKKLVTISLDKRLRPFEKSQWIESILKDKQQLIEAIETSTKRYGSYQARLSTPDIKRLLQTDVTPKEMIQAIRYVKQTQKIEENLQRQKEREIDDKDRSY